MMRYIFSGVMLLMAMAGCSEKREFRDGQWRAELERKDGNNVVFNFEVKDSAGRKILYMRNAGERLVVDSVTVEGDSVVIRMPFFESQLQLPVQLPLIQARLGSANHSIRVLLSIKVHGLCPSLFLSTHGHKMGSSPA